MSAANNSANNTGIDTTNNIVNTVHVPPLPETYMNLKTYLEKSSQSELAHALGVTQGTISHWLTGRVRVPAERVIPIEQATGGKVTRQELRPDLYPEHVKRAA